MERRDGKDPFDAATYVRPATIKSMVELRAFCAAFFEEHVRDHSPTIGQTLLARFLDLICHSTLLFARARAVIPELQHNIVHGSESTHLNPNLLRVLQVTEDHRRLPDTSWGPLIEESAWTRLAKDGQERFMREAERIAKNLKKKEAGEPVSPLCSGNLLSPASAGTLRENTAAGGRISPLRLTTPASTEAMEAKTATDQPAMPSTQGDSSPHVPSNKPSPHKSGFSMKPLKLENIPTFIPSAQLGNAHDIVWSPTSGTRPRKPEEKADSQLGHSPADGAGFGREISVNTPRFVKLHPHPYNLKADTPEKKHERGYSTSEIANAECYPSPVSLLAQAESSHLQPRSNMLSGHRLRNSLDAKSSPGSRLSFAEPTSRMNLQFHQTGVIGENTNEMYPSDFNAIRHHVNRTPSIIDEPFSTPPRISGFGESHRNEQTFHAEQEPAPYGSQPYLEQFGAAGSPPFHPQHGQSPLTEAGGFPLQPQHYNDSRSPPFNPRHPQDYHRNPRPNPRRGTHQPSYTQQAPQFPLNEPLWSTLAIPPPGSMHPIDYWNMLHQRTLAITTRLARTAAPLTPTQQIYLAALDEARLAAISSKLPPRGQMAAAEWRGVLSRELEVLWMEGTMPVTELVRERKKDYERVLRREIEMLEVEGEKLGQ